MAGAAALFHRHRRDRADWLLDMSFALLAVAVGLQLLPLPGALLRRVSPETDATLRSIAVGYAGSTRHPLSIDPGGTLLGLAALAALALAFLGLSRALTRDDSLRIARGVAILGIVLAVAGIIQKALWNGKIYGFWTPFGAGSSFGPFVNRNHFAGWMLMTIPLTVGYLCGRIARGARYAKPGVRNRLLWLSSADASETILIAFAVLLMALSVALTMSRSGMVGLLAVLIAFGWVVLRRQATRSRRALNLGYLVVVILVAVAWTGVDTIAARFADRQSPGSAGRREVWADSWRLARKFPAAGTGLNTFGSAMVVHQTVDRTEHLNAAHNDYLQVLAEGGALVSVPAAFAVIVVAATIRRRFRSVPVESTDYWIRVGAVTGILAIAVQEAADFSLQMPGNAVMFVVLLAIAARHSASERRTA
ncbi:MAG: O-antigen ligase family protein [Acidobacteriota bacterium]